MSLGESPRQQVLDELSAMCAARVPERSVFAFLHRERDRLFPDEMFEDLFSTRGRRSVPPAVVACVLVLQRLEALSDREAVERFTFDARWKWACGVPSDFPSFVHTVLVDFRERLRRSADPERIFTATCALAREAGLVGARRALDSTPLYDAVSTMDTVTLIRSGIRGLLRTLSDEQREAVTARLARDDDYSQAGKPACDWDDAAARGALIDALARDGYAALDELDGRDLGTEQGQAAELLASLLGQDLETGDEGRFRIIRGVARDRVISTVDPDARHGHKTNRRGFDGYKGHIAIDPDSEVITSAEVSAGNVGDGQLASELTQDLKDQSATDTARKQVYGDSAYASGDNLAEYHEHELDAMTKLPPPSNSAGLYTKDDFVIDLDERRVTCPAGTCVPLKARKDGAGVATFGAACATCPLLSRCTNATNGRSVRVGPHERLLRAQRERQRDPAWQADYKATRPKVERKLAHLLAQGRARRLCVRGLSRARQQWQHTAAGINLKRFATLDISHHAGRWTTPQPA